MNLTGISRPCDGSTVRQLLKQRQPNPGRVLARICETTTSHSQHSPSLACNQRSEHQVGFYKFPLVCIFNKQTLHLYLFTSLNSVVLISHIAEWSQSYITDKKILWLASGNKEGEKESCCELRSFGPKPRAPRQRTPPSIAANAILECSVSEFPWGRG